MVTNLYRVFAVIGVWRSSKCASIFFLLKAVNYCDTLREHVAQLRPRETGPDHRHIAIGRDETREVRVKGSYHTSAIVPSLGLASRSESFRPLVHLFAPLFSFSNLLPLTSLPPPPFHNTGSLFSICSTLRRIGAWALRRPTPVPFSFPAFIFIIIITIIRVSIFTSARRFVVSVKHIIIIIIYDDEASIPLPNLRFIMVYSSRILTYIPKERNLNCDIILIELFIFDVIHWEKCSG